MNEEKQIFMVSDLISERDVLLLNGISTGAGLSIEKSIQERFEHAHGGNDIFTVSFKQNEPLNLIYQQIGFIIKEGTIYNVSDHDTGENNINRPFPNKYPWSEVDSVLNGNRTEYNEFIVRAESIYGFFILSFTLNKVFNIEILQDSPVDFGEIKNVFYTDTNIKDFLNSNELPLILITKNQFFKVTVLDKIEKEPISWEDLKKELLN